MSRRDDNNIEGATSEEAKEYQAMKNRLFLFQLILNFLFLTGMIASGVSQGLRLGLENLQNNFFILNALYLVCFGAIASCLFFPLDFYEGFILEHRYGLSRQKFAGWFKDVLKKGVIVSIVSLVLVEAVYFFLSQFLRFWWLWACGFWFVVSVVLTKITPKIILPLFFKSSALPEGILRERISKLLSAHGVRLANIFILDFSKKTVKANAMVAGLGRTKQIYLSDTLVNEFREDEIEVVLAHELGHYLHRDTFKLVVAGLISSFLSFLCADKVLDWLIPVLGFRGLNDVAGLPLLLLVFSGLGLVLLPLQNGFSRLLETRADLFALEATKNQEAFISLMTRLGKKNFSDFAPSKVVEIFLYDHPSLSKRIRLAQKYQES